MSALSPQLATAAVRMRAGRLKEAAAIVETVLAQEPENAEALHLAGSIANMRGDREAAAAWFERGLAAHPDAVPLLCGLANHHRARGRFDDAIALYDRALVADPASTPAIVGKAGVLERAGRHDDARAVLAPLVESGDTSPAGGFLHATLLHHAGDDLEAARVLALFLAKSGLAPIMRRKMLYLHGACREKLGETEAAFNSYQSANQILVRPFEIGPTLARFDRLAGLTRDRLATLPAASSRDERPVFIVGMPRCGSTLVEQILDAHPAVRGAGEVPHFAHAVQPLLDATGVDGDESGHGEFDQATVDAAAAAYHAALDDHHDGETDGPEPGIRRIIDKNLANFRFLGLIDRMCPGARVIHCRRDPLTTCFSIFTLPLSPASHPYKTELSRLGRYYRAYQSLMAAWRDAISIPMLEVDYEAVVADPEAQTRAILEFCDLPWDDACLRFHESDRAAGTLSYDQVRRPIYDSSVGRAVPFASYLKPLRDAIKGPA